MGVFTLALSQISAFTENSGAAVFQQSARASINLFANQNAPTIMEAWELLAINAPLQIGMNANALTEAEAEALATQNMSVAIQLLYGGEVIWGDSSGTVTPPLSTPLAGFATWLQYVNLGQQFTSPLEIRRGRTLELLIEVAGTLGGGKARKTGIFATLGLGPDSTRVAATLMYESLALSGHRTL